MAEKESLPLPSLYHVRPPVSLDVVAPPLANQVRVIQSADSLMIQAYYLNPTAVESAVEGREQPHIRIDGDTAYIELAPVARFALPLSVAGDLVALLIKNLAFLGPKIGPMIAEQLRQAAAATVVPAAEAPAAGVKP